MEKQQSLWIGLLVLLILIVIAFAFYHHHKKAKEAAAAAAAAATAAAVAAAAATAAAKAAKAAKANATKTLSGYNYADCDGQYTLSATDSSGQKLYEKTDGTRNLTVTPSGSITCGVPLSSNGSGGGVFYTYQNGVNGVLFQ